MTLNLILYIYKKNTNYDHTNQLSRSWKTIVVRTISINFNYFKEMKNINLNI